MRPVLICALLGSGVFFAGLLQMGVWRRGAGNLPSAEVPTSPPVVEKAKFPDDLAPAAQALVVAKAAEYKLGPVPHKMVIMTPKGELHEWHEKLPEEWCAESVEETELVIVVGRDKSKLLQKVHFRNGPPIDRVQWELEISVVAAKSGTVLDNRKFENIPRDCANGEAYATTRIGRPVQWHTVWDWISKKTKSGFPEEETPLSIITIVK
jgi:hypothetical protein